MTPALPLMGFEQRRKWVEVECLAWPCPLRASHCRNPDWKRKKQNKKSGIRCVPNDETEPSFVSRQPGGTGGGADGEEEEEEGIMRLDRGM